MIAGVTLFTACGDDLVTPDEGNARSIQIVQGAIQTGTAGQPLPVDLVVRVNDDVGRPVAQQPLTISLDDGGSISPAQPVTNNEGRATFRWTLGPAAGAQQLSVATAASGPTVVFRGTAASATANVVAIVSGNGQTGQAGRALADSLVIRVTDQFDNPVSDATVTWTTTDGSVSPTSSTTGENGLARTQWTLGATAGSQNVTVSVAGIPDPTSFSATATPGPTPNLSVDRQPSATLQSGDELDRQPRIRLQDGEGNDLSTAGVVVTATLQGGNGTLSGTVTATTGPNGRADFSDLGITGVPGLYTLRFAASGFTSVESAVIDVTPADPSAGNSSLTISADSVTAGGTVTLTATILDAANQPVPGVNVVFEVSGSGQTVQQPGVPTGNDGVATGTVVPTTAGTRVISATASGTALQQTRTLIVAAGARDASNTDAEIDAATILSFVTITIHTRDQFSNPLTVGGNASRLAVTVTGVNANSPLVTDAGDGTYTAQYLRLLPGESSIAITLDGIPIKGSPYVIGN